MLETYDIFLVDAYGVFWDGTGFISDTKEQLKALVENGKTVIILSNTTQRSIHATQKYARHGLKQGEHFHALVTSGEVLRRKLEKGLVLEGKEVTRYYNFGTPNPVLFEGLPYSPVSLEEAEFIYIGIPQMTMEQKKRLEDQHPFYASCATDSCWDTTEIAAFSSMIKKMAASGLPILNANPDITASEKCAITHETHHVIRQGAIARQLENRGMKLYQVGKPYGEVYAFCRQLLCEELHISPADMQRLKVVMVGDTVGTDILGAHNATMQLDWPVESILTLTGSAMQGINAEIQQDREKVMRHLKAQFDREGCSPSHIITSFGREGRCF